MTQRNDAPYLYAIQEIPGATAGEKYKWIEKLTSGQRQGSGDLDRVPSELLPLVRANTAVKKRIHEDIAWALKSDDQAIVNRAIQATWFFDGSHKDVINDKFLREHVFPYVSFKTRKRLVKRLAVALTGRDPDYARQIFTTTRSVYGLQQALPLLMACDEDFAFRTITNDNIQLSHNIAKRFFQINPDFMVRYLRLSGTNDDGPFKDNIWKHSSLLPLLIRKRLEIFVELYEMCQQQNRGTPCIKLSRTRAATLIKRGAQYLANKPRLYIDFLPLDMIPEKLMESMLPGLLPDCYSDYYRFNITKYLKPYPEEMKAALLCKMYRDKYGKELFQTKSNITPELMRLLPMEERIKQAKIMIEWENERDTPAKSILDYENIWICYLPTKECIPIIKEMISKQPKKEARLGLMWRMIYACKVNKDDDALLETLLYFKIRHKNEEYWVFDRLMDKIVELYDVPHLNEKVWTALSDIIRIFYVKYGETTQEILLAMVHHKLIHSMSITEPVDMILETQNKRGYINFYYNFQEELQYERQYLVTYIDIFHKKYNTTDWAESRNNFLYRIVEAMYAFNDKCAKSHATIEHLTIRDYRWLMDCARDAIWNLSDRSYYYNDMRTILSKHEPDLCKEWYPKLKEVIVKDEDMTSGAVLKVLRQNPQHILDNWQEYLTACKKYHFSKKVQHFVRSIRWYADIPIKFMERCMLDLRKVNSESCSLPILALLLHGETLTKLLHPLVSKEVQITADYSASRAEYAFMLFLPIAMKLSNPPVSLDLVTRQCEGDCLSAALRTLPYLVMHTSLPKVISFARNMSEQRVSVRKHGIRMMCLVALKRDIVDFLLYTWQKEDHYSIRAVLLQKAHELFYAEQNSDTWSLLSSLVLSITPKDGEWFPTMVQSPLIFGTYAVKYIELLFEALDTLSANGLNAKKAKDCTILLLRKISKHAICNLLPDEFTKKLIEKYLFHIDANISETMRYFTIDSYLSPKHENFTLRMKIFADIFANEVKSRWDVSHPRKKGYYPINHAINLFVKSLVSDFIDGNSIDPRLISEMLDIFSSVLTPQMEPRSYLLLTYAKKWDKSPTASPTLYGRHVGHQIPGLVKTFSPLFIPFMANTLNEFLHRHSEFRKIIPDVIKGLIDAATTESCFMAATVLSLQESAIFNELVEELQKMDHPGIKSILNNSRNERSYGCAGSDNE